MSKFKVKIRHKRSWFTILIISLSVYSCIETFFPELDNSLGMLVVDALVTDESRPYDVYLSRSVSSLKSKITMVKGAIVRVSDNSGNVFVLRESGSGHYITDSKKFKGEVGKKYVLYIRTTNGEEFQSDSCTMVGVSKIDRLYFRRNIKYSEDGKTELEGISFYADGSVTNKENCFVRWDFTEAWKTSVPYFPEFSFSAPNTFTPVPEKNKYCWKNAISSNILIHSFQDQATPEVKEKEIGFFVPDESDRFNERYSILVNQYAITREEYDFWNRLKQTNEDPGGIFERQPYSISGNIKNLKNPKDPVLGYFQVASVSSMRLYVNYYQVVNLKLPLSYPYCDIRTIQIGDSTETGKVTTLTEIYSYLTKHDSTMLRPYYNNFGLLRGMIITSRKCADCSTSGNPVKPSFWLDN
jgi:hypothetical protein